ncbi:heterokaryon incompatibility protein-domain-containing protein [Colletotrichum phormii]|uniref:Heterokaryon incompatibility protein-domain-containing protein n=1 Tax=Colletotrichum phormii TaxID=359342 RepID=A0AAJ0EGB6_9PEZI|nr:heterokaryon incompatibility protein-domain-containing protein [Colletotrichum phormii]KAK1635891.1 heterokaryon incompatibility protein-domain-containing protein [Colletotrichum phormii]
MASLCSVCKGITPQALAQPDGYRHIESAHDLIHSAKVCEFCSLIRRAMDQDCRTPKTDDQFPTNTKPEPLYLFGVGDGLATAEDACGDGIERSEPPKLFGINVHIPDIEYEYDLVRLSLFSEPGTAPSRNKDVVGMRLLTDSGSNEVFGLVERWYNTSKNNHTECNETFTGTVGSLTKSYEPLLPTRVLDVGSADGSGEPKLLVNNGTHASIAQDAIRIVRFLGLRYLWIDSLCIVQDNADDWRKESVQMGRIYKDAEITVAASGARDGSEGCFVPRPPLQPVVRLPYSEPSQGEYMSATLFPDSINTTVSETPLDNRAWITQEWMLSPRVIHYTKARLVWACRTLLKCEDEALRERPALPTSQALAAERGDSYVDNEEIMGFYADWCDLVSTYAARNLTYDSDKPVAILGLVTEVGNGIGERYTYGVFYNDSLLSEDFHAHCVVTQLLWFAKLTLTRPSALRDQPTWSWTSTIGAISFLVPARAAENRNSDIIRVQPKISASSWKFSALLKEWEARREGDSSTRTGDDYYYMEFYPKGSITYGGFVTQNTKPISGRDMAPAGWVVFDSNVGTARLIRSNGQVSWAGWRLPWAKWDNWLSHHGRLRWGNHPGRPHLLRSAPAHNVIRKNKNNSNYHGHRRDCCRRYTLMRKCITPVIPTSNEWPAKPYYLAIISANEFDGKPDGFKLMFLAEVKPDLGLGSYRRFERLGVG